MGAKDAYDQSVNKLKNVDPDPNNMFDIFLAEKSLNINKVWFKKLNINRLTLFNPKERLISSDKELKMLLLNRWKRRMIQISDLEFKRS